MSGLLGWIDAHPRQAVVVSVLVGAVGFIDSVLSIADRFEGGVDLFGLLAVVRLFAGPLALLLALLILWRLRHISAQPSIAADSAPSSAPETRWKKAAITFLTWLYRRDEWHGLSREQQRAESVPLTDEEGSYARRRLDHVGLKGETYEPRIDVGMEPWWEPPRLTGPDRDDTHDSMPVWASTSRASAWLPDATDPTTLALLGEDLDIAIERATKVAGEQLAPDAQLEFSCLMLRPLPILVFDAWSAMAARTAQIGVTELNADVLMFDKPPLDDDFWERKSPEPPWKRDSTWHALILKVGYRHRPLAGEITIRHLPSILKYEPDADSAWHAEVRGDGLYEMYVLSGGRLKATQWPAG